MATDERASLCGWCPDHDDEHPAAFDTILESMVHTALHDTVAGHQVAFVVIQQEPSTALEDEDELDRVMPEP